MIDKYGFLSLEVFVLFCVVHFKALEVYVNVLKMQLQLAVHWKYQAVATMQALCSRDAFVVFLLLLFPLEIWVSLC